MKADPDRLLIECAKNGDVSAFGELVQKYQKRIYDLAYRFTHHPEDAADLCQEIFIKAFRALGKFENKSTFYTWIYQIAKNTCIDYSRRRTGRYDVTFVEEISLDDSHAQSHYSADRAYRRVEQAELETEIKKAIEQLSPRQKQVFILRHYEGLALREIAVTLDLRVGSVKAHLFNATRKLRKLLTPYMEE